MRYLILLFSCFMLLGCSSASKPGSTFSGNTSENIIGIKEDTITAIDAIDTSNKSIVTSIDLITKDTAAIDKSISNSNLAATILPLTKSINDNAATILRNNNDIDAYIAKIKGLANRLDSANEDVLKLSATIKKLDVENKQIQQDATKKLYSILATMFGFSCLIVGAGIFLIIFGNKSLGFQIIGLGIFMLCLSAAATVYFKEVAIIGLGIVIAGILGVLVIFIISIFKKNKEVQGYSQATSEVVQTVEAIKQHIPNDVRIKLFGDRAVPGIAQTIQSDKTQQIVSDIRSNGLGAKIMPTIPNNAVSTVSASGLTS